MKRIQSPSTDDAGIEAEIQAKGPAGPGQITPGPNHTITLSITATGLFTGSMSFGALLAAIQQATLHPAVVNGTLDATGNVLMVHDESTGVAIHVYATRTSVRHL